MAVNYLFDTKYFARRGDAAPSGTAQNKYRVVIGDHTGTVSATSSEIVLFDPGIKIKWDGDQGRFSNAIMGSSLEFTARLDDAQLATWNSLLDLNEGSVFCLFFDNHSTNAKPWWWGHLMIESTSIRVENEHHTIDLTFSDGLAALRGAKWENSPGVFYTGFKKLSFYMREIQSKIPAFPGYKDYIDNVVSETYRPVFTHIGFPFPATESEGTEYRYDELDALFDHIRVRADTFNKPKKQVDRTRELEAAPDFFNAAEVLEDICKTFGATACVFNGFINLGGRLDSAFLKGIDVHKLNYYYDASGADTWQITSEYNSDTKLLNSQNFYEVKAGATMGRTLPIAQANLTHEEGGSDYLAADGYFLDSNISHLDYSDAYQYQQLHSASFGGTNFFPPDGMRQDLWYDFDYDNRNDPAVSTPFYTYPANRTGYLGFPARTLDELEVPSGEVMQLTFGGQVMLPSRSKLGAFINNSSHIGSVVVVRLRIQFKATNGTYYRLSRTVHTHALTGGTPDFINIDMQLWPFTSLGDKKFFRKLYNDVDWVPSTSPTAYADSWFEIIVPHGDSENSGEGYGATLHTLTQEYDGQVSYAPIGTKIKGENDGAGVILKFSSEGEGTYNQYFRIDESFELPYGAGDATLSFDEFYFEMGIAQWDSDRGPRGNGTATGDWLGETPTWHSAYADGTGGSQISTDKEKGPSYIHFTGLRVAIGDGSESSDFTTKMAGGDGYEIHNMGSSRLGSRKAFVQPHLNGTLWVKRKTADASGSFASPAVYDEKVRWFGHRGHDLSTMPNTLYDSLHGYVTESFLQLFGESRVKYNMTLIPKNTGSSDGFGALINPFVVMETNGLIDDKDIDEYLMPLSYSWVMNEGVSGEFLKVGQARDRSSIGPVFVPRPAKGPGGIVGLGTGIDLTKPVFQSKFVTDAITVDDETGDITVITVKTGSTVFSSDSISEGSSNKFVTSTTFSNAPVLQDRTGSADPVEAIKEDMDKISMLADSTIEGYGGVKRFTLANFAEAIVQSGLEDLVGEGYGSLADFSGTTGLLGDLDDDGSVGVSDLLSFLTLFGNVYESDSDLFQSSRVPLDVDSGEMGVNIAPGSTPSLITLPFTSAHFDSSDSDFTAGSNGVNVLYSDNQVQFVSGNGLPITAWARKMVAVKPDGLQPILYINTSFPNQQFQFGYKVFEYNDSSNLVRETFVTLSVFLLEAPRQDGHTLNRQDLNIPATGMMLDVDDNDITDIRVEMQIRGTTDAVTQYTVQLRNFRIDLRD